ncbi:hypothetical protein A0O28_0063650 [Trichoderma guizhouense]|uniref:Uncharacterized protein n=1 Tax=Trichoderma guizhouense TaxID=1491466 RepID=A0A1T3CYV8_9HYPO|nr:hypothetical protein A0O28_0063650 [Trichoderma guizhouense]
MEQLKYQPFLLKMPANKNNDANQQQGPRGQKRRNEQSARTGPAAGNDDVTSQDLDVKVEALFEQCGKKDEKVAKKAEENVREESRTSWW